MTSNPGFHTTLKAMKTKPKLKDVLAGMMEDQTNAIVAKRTAAVRKAEAATAEKRARLKALAAEELPLACETIAESCKKNFLKGELIVTGFTVFCPVNFPNVIRHHLEDLAQWAIREGLQAERHPNRVVEVPGLGTASTPWLRMEWHVPTEIAETASPAKRTEAIELLEEILTDQRLDPTRQQRETLRQLKSGKLGNAAREFLVEIERVAEEGEAAKRAHAESLDPRYMGVRHSSPYTATPRSATRED